MFLAQTMKNTQHTHTMQSAILNNALALTASDPNRISRRTSDLSFCMAYEKAAQTVLKPIVLLEAVLKSDTESPPFLPAQQPVPALTVELSKSNLLVLRQTNDLMRQMAREEHEGIHASRGDPFMSKAAEKALLDAFSSTATAQKIN